MIVVAVDKIGLKVIEMISAMVAVEEIADVVAVVVTMKLQAQQLATK